MNDINDKVARIRKQRIRKRLNENLKPCPFCGGKAYIRNITENNGKCHYKIVCVECIECKSKTDKRISDGYYGKYCSDEEIVELWNRRVNQIL